MGDVGVVLDVVECVCIGVLVVEIDVCVFFYVYYCYIEEDVEVGVDEEFLEYCEFVV